VGQLLICRRVRSNRFYDYVCLILGGEANNPYAALGTGVLTVICLLVALIYFYPSLLLFKYANAAKQAVLYADQATLAVAMSKMKSFFKFWGILTIVFLTFYVLSILVTIVASIGTVNVAP
jgi:hypothetical protein